MVKKSLCLTIITLLIILTGCFVPDSANEVPLSIEYITQVIADSGLSWDTDSINTIKENDIMINFSREDKANCGLMVRRLDSGFRSVSLRFAYLREIIDHMTEISDLISSGDMADFIDIAGTLYGNRKEVQSVFNEFSASASSSYYTTQTTQTFIKRSGDNHYQFKGVSYDGGKTYTIEAMFVANTTAYEKHMQNIASAYEVNGNYLMSEGTVSEAAIALTTYENQAVSDRLPPCVAVKGVISNIRDVTVDGKKLMTRVLKDDSGELEVYLEPTTLSAKELSHTRIHYVLPGKTMYPGAAVSASTACSS